MPAQYDAIKRSLVKQGYGHSTESPAIKSRAAKIFIVRGRGRSRSARARSLQADRKIGR